MAGQAVAGANDGVEATRPVISMFHGLPHIHVQYGEQNAVYEIEEGRRLQGELPRAKERLVVAWIELHREELAADWQLAVNGETPFRIDPLR
ncbi:MAG: hypothetical protein RIT45_2459 [Pseudomonadota bacterium]|jgi:hypothetical protein